MDPKKLNIANRKRKVIEDDEDESSDNELESFLFGKSKKNDAFEEIKDETEETNENETELLSFSISTKPSHQTDNKSKEDNVEPIRKNEPVKLSKEKKAVWEDPDDENLSIDVDNRKLKRLKKNREEKNISGQTLKSRLKEKFEKVLPPPAWADIKLDDDEDENNKLFKTTSNLLDKSSFLPNGVLGFEKKTNLCRKKPGETGITSLEFHPSAKLALTATMSKRLNIYQADGEKNKKLQSIFVDNFPISTAHFTCSGNKIVMTAGKNFFHVFDLIAGEMTRIRGLKGLDREIYDKFVVSPDGKQIAFLGSNGFLHFASAESMHYQYSLKMNGSLDSATFQSMDTIFSTGGDGEVYIWDARKRKCIHRFVDEGSIGSTCIACSNNKKFVAVGSKSGIVNIYKDTYLESKEPKPLKTLKNLITEVDGLKFNSSSEILAYYSESQRNAVKLLHFPSLTTFQNWPTINESLGHVTCVDFSPLSGYLGIGNDKGSALLYRLKHFPDA